MEVSLKHNKFEGQDILFCCENSSTWTCLPLIVHFFLLSILAFSSIPIHPNNNNEKEKKSQHLMKLVLEFLGAMTLVSVCYKQRQTLKLN